MCNWMDYLVSTSTDYIRDESWTGDWLAVNEPKTPIEVTDTAFCAYSAMLLSEIAEALGKDSDAEKYSVLYNCYRDAWRESFLEDDGFTTKCGTQTSYVLGIKFKLFDEDKIPEAAKNLVENIKGWNWHLSTGFLGLSYLNPVLSDTGYSEAAFKLLEQEEYPSWLYSVTLDSTSIWESWYVIRRNSNGTKTINEESQNHFSYGAVSEWLFRYMLGIDRDDESSVAFKHFVLKPEFGGSFTYANGSYDSIRGTIESGWALDKETGAFTYNAVVPVNTTATLYLPVKSENTAVTESGVLANESDGVTYVGYQDGHAVYELASGSYEFVTYVNPDMNNISSVKITNSQNIDATVTVSGKSFDRFPAYEIVAASEFTVDVVSNEENYAFSHFVSENGEVIEADNVFSGDMAVDMVFAYTGADDGDENTKTVTITGQDGITIEINGSKYKLPYSGVFDKGELVEIKVFVDVYAKEFSNLGCIKSAGDVIYLMPSEDITKEIELCDARYIKGYDVFFDFTDNIAHWKGSNAKLSFEPGYMRFDAVKKADGSFDPRAYYDFTESESTITGGEYVPSEMYDGLEIGFVADEVAANSTPVLYISTEDLPSFLSPVRSRKASSAITTGMADGNTLQKTEFSLSDWDNWTGNIKQVYLDLIDNVDGSIRIDYIRFKHRNFKLTVKTNPNDLGTVYEYMPGETALLAALETEEGFLGYSLDAGSKDYITEVVMSKDTVIYANYDNDDSDDDSNDENNSSVILWDFEDNTLQNWINANAHSSSVNNGVVKVTHTTSWADAYFYTSGVNAAASKYKYIVAKIRHNVPEGQKGTKPFEVFFRRTTDNWSQGLSVNTELLPASDDFKTYIFDMSENANWNGTIDYIRIDPFEAVSSADNAFYYEMDSIMLAEEAFLVLNPNYSGAETVTYGVPSDFEINPCDYLIPERDGYQFAGWTNGENSDTVTNITVTGSVRLYAKWEKSYSAYIWDFEDGLAEDWTVANSINRGVTNGVWQVEFSTATSDAWIKNESLEFPASVYKYIVIELKHNIPEGEFGTRPLEVFFVREGDTPWQQHLSVNVPQVSSAGENFNTYVIDMSECANWTNTVKRLRIDPFEKKSDTDNVYYFEIDRIAICPELTLTLDYGNGKTEYAVPAQTTIDLSLYDEPESEDMIFVGWSRSADGEIIDTVSLSENTTLYAVWSESGTSISLTDEYVNVKTEVLAVLVVSSYYDNGKMCDCIVRFVNETTKFIFEEEGLDVESASTVKAFLFDSATGMRPLCKSKEVPVIDEYANFVKLIDDNACYSEYMSAEGTSFVFPSVLGNQMVASWTNGDVVYKSGSVVDAEYVRKEEFTIKDYADVSVLNGLNIVCIGDSLTQGDYGWIPAGTANVKKEGYPYFFELFTGANVTNAGRCGYSCELYYNYLPNVTALTAQTDVVIIMLGTNNGLTDTIEDDTASGNPESFATTQTGYYARIIESVAEKTEGNAQIILMTPPVTTKRDRAFLESTCEVIKKFGEKYGLAVIDNYNNCGITYDNIKTYMPIDELHCGYDGYKMLAAHVALKTAEYCNNAEDCGYLLEYAELDEDIGFIGRWYDKTVNGVECKATISQGAEMFFMVEGTKNVSLRLHSTAQKAPVIAVSVDGRAPVRMTTALTGDMTVAQNLSADKHYIRIIVDGFYEYQANKWSTGDGFAIEKVVVDDGGKVTGLEPENPVILYYGDSITEGVNVLGTGSTPDSNSAVYEFPFVTSHLLGAVSYTNGFGASGVTKGGSGGVPKCLTTIDSILENTSIDSCKNPYAIVVNHGHNDGSATSETFITEYKAVLSRLREKYPDTPIFAVVPYFQIHSANIKTAVEQMGDDRIFYISTNGWEYTTSDGVHPDRNGAEKLGTRLAEEMAKILKAEEMRPTETEITNHTTANLWHEGEVPYHDETATNYATITPYIVEDSDEAVVIFPGGGYFQLSTVNEGTLIAQAYNAKGISAFVVTYRYKPYSGNAILADGQRAVQYVRYFADDVGINPDKIAVLGFSAGGHLATMVCQHEPEENLAGDAVGEVSSVPNVVLLGYAVTTLGDGTYSTMPGIFLGEENKTNSSLVEKYSYTNDISKMPPAFIFYSTLDAAVNPEKNSIPLATAMENAGKTVEIHGYTDGNHGIGLGTGYEDFSKWIDDSCVFLEKING